MDFKHFVQKTDFQILPDLARYLNSEFPASHLNVETSNLNIQISYFKIKEGDGRHEPQALILFLGPGIQALIWDLGMPQKVIARLGFFKVPKKVSAHLGFPAGNQPVGHELVGNEPVAHDPEGNEPVGHEPEGNDQDKSQRPRTSRRRTSRPRSKRQRTSRL